jgi:tRNA U34 5-methylaminomethyl-2-thiouridine-forming methyltransferase MnmC
VALKPAHLQWSEDGILRSADFGDIYFQPKQGMAESHYVFQPAGQKE